MPLVAAPLVTMPWAYGRQDEDCGLCGARRRTIKTRPNKKLRSKKNRAQLAASPALSYHAGSGHESESEFTWDSQHAASNVTVTWGRTSTTPSP